MGAPISPYNVTVHVKTQDEACEVVAWFESFGFHREALQPNNYLDYPFIFFNNRTNLLTGCASPVNFGHHTVMEYEDWAYAVYNAEAELESDPIDEEAFLELLKGSMQCVRGA